MLFHVKRNPAVAWRTSLEWLDILAIGRRGKIYARSQRGFVIFQGGDIKIAANLAEARGNGYEFYMAEKDAS